MADSTLGHGFDPGNPPERTAEQLAAVHAAMMEELGIGRKDELPLEDRGKVNHAPNPKPVNKPIVTTGLASAWHNVQFDDNDPAEDDLDSIADGQLYRLRRGASYGSQDNFGSRGSRGGRGGRGSRGSAAPRGGHASPGRGGARFSGDGRRGNQVPIANFTQAFFNDARRSLNSRQRVDQCLANLRAQVGQAANSSQQINDRSFTEPPAVLVLEQSQPPRRAERGPAKFGFSLASAQDFLAHINPCDARLPRRHPSVTESATSRSIENVPVKTETSDRPKGLAGSISAEASAPLPAQPTLLPQYPTQTNGTPAGRLSNTQSIDSTASRSSGDDTKIVKRENEVRFRCDFQDDETGLARLVKQSESDEFYTFELLVNKQGCVRGVISDDVLFKVESAVLTYRAPGEGSQIWQALFRHPYMATNFYEQARPKRTPEKPDQNKFRELPASLSTPAPIKPNLSLPAVASALEPDMLEQLNVSEPVGSTCVSAAQSNSQPYILDAVKSKEQVNQNHSTGSDEISQPASEQQNELLLDFSTNAPQSPSEDTGSRISCQVYSQMTEVAGVDPLMSLSDHEDRHEEEVTTGEVPPARRQTIQELLFDMQKKDDSKEIFDILAKLDSRPEGTFLQQVSALVVASGGLPANKLSKEELFSPPWSQFYSVASQKIVSNFLSGSEIFKELPDLVSMMWMGDMSHKILALAINHEHKTAAQSSDCVSVDRVHEADISLAEDLIGIDEGIEPGLHNDMCSSLGNPATIEHDEGDVFMTTNQSQGPSSPTTGLNNTSAMNLDSSADMTADQGQNPSPLTTCLSNASILDHSNSVDVTMNVDQYQDASLLTAASDPLTNTSMRQCITASDSENNLQVDDSASRVAQKDNIEGSPIGMSIEQLLKLRQYAFKVTRKLIDDAWLANPIGLSSGRVTTTSSIEPASKNMEDPSNESQSTPGHMYPQIPQNVASKWQGVGRQTDMEMWSSILDKDKKAKSTGTHIISNEPREKIPPTAPRVHGHVPTNSECDRLAQKLEGWHMNLSFDDRQLPMELESNNVARHMQNGAFSAVDVAIEVAPLARPLSSASKRSTSASQSMTEKLTTALKSPLTFSPRLKTTIEAAGTRVQAIEGQTGAVRTKETSTLDECNIISQDSSAPGNFSWHVNSNYPIQSMPLAMNSGGTTKASTPIQSLSTVSTAISTTSHDTNRASTPGPMATGGSSPRSGAVLSPDKRAFVEKLRKSPGLAASRWAKDENEFATPQQMFSKSIRGTPRRLDPANAPVCQPTGLTDQSHLIQTQPSYAPLMATIITRDPQTGEFREVEGMLKAGSVPVVPHVPIFLGGLPRSQANVPLQSMMQTGFYNFPPRPENPRYSSGSSEFENHRELGIASNSLSPQEVKDHNGRMVLPPV